MGDGTTSTFQLKGWPAVFVILAVVGFGVWKAIAVRSTLDTEGRERIEEAIRLEYARELMAETPASAMGAEEAEALLATQRIEVVDMAFRGPRDDMVARVEARLDGGLPPDGEAVSYWRIRWGSGTGWTVRGRTDETRWWFAIL